MLTSSFKIFSDVQDFTLSPTSAERHQVHEARPTWAPGNPDTPVSARRVVSVLSLWEPPPSGSSPAPKIPPLACSGFYFLGAHLGGKPAPGGHRACLAPRHTRHGLRSWAAFCICLNAWAVFGAGARSAYCSNLAGRPQKWVKQQSLEWAWRCAPHPDSCQTPLATHRTKMCFQRLLALDNQLPNPPFLQPLFTQI